MDTRASQWIIVPLTIVEVAMKMLFASLLALENTVVNAVKVTEVMGSSVMKLMSAKKTMVDAARGRGKILY